MKFYLSMFIALSFSSAYATNSSKSLCGLTDERTPSSEPRVGKLVRTANGAAGCSASMISKNCAISAGHCKKSLVYLHFNEDSQGAFRNEDIYEVDTKSLEYFDNNGTDFSVFKLKKNPLTGKAAGEAQGYYKVRFDKIKVGDIISITGHGKSADPNVTFRQQTLSGPITNDFGTRLYHTIDTEGGNSGSGFVLESTDEIIGVHTHGGCYAYGGGNSGTSISGSKLFREAVQKCLKSDL